MTVEEDQPYTSFDTDILKTGTCSVAAEMAESKTNPKQEKGEKTPFRLWKTGGDSEPIGNGAFLSCKRCKGDA